MKRQSLRSFQGLGLPQPLSVQSRFLKKNLKLQLEKFSEHLDRTMHGRKHQYLVPNKHTTGKIIGIFQNFTSIAEKGGPISHVLIQDFKKNYKRIGPIKHIGKDFFMKININVLHVFLQSRVCSIGVHRQ